ncbi:MAG: ABC transporter permease [Armatimonadetes bacterium]|nr:ABC transporter permease [Armatimonadota bacterium]
MVAYTIKRILGAFPLVLAVVVINFALLHLAPGDPVYVFLQGGAGEVTEQYVQQMRRQLGLDKPLAEQLVVYVAGVLRGNLGYSHFYQSPVFQIIVERMPVTYLLVLLSTLFAAIAGIALGVSAANHPHAFVDRVCTVTAVFGYSIPVFWLGQLLIIAFSVYFSIFPTGGIPASALGQGGLLDWALHLTLPVVCLGVIQLTLVARVTRASMLEIYGMEYIVSARAKGLSNMTVTLKHSLRNAFLPIVTVISMDFAFQIAGAMVTETVFSWPGLGRLMFDSVLRRDYPVLMGLLILTSVSVIVINLVTDIFYAYLDPRVVYQ